MSKFKLFIHKLLNWEYWPTQCIYYPIIVPLWVYYSIRAKSLCFFSAANPSIKNGGMLMESKKEIYDIIPSRYIPKTILIKKGTGFAEVKKALEKASITFPCILKPDIGMKAFGVEKIKKIKDLETYLHKIKEDFLVQEFIPYPKEIGIFYIRYPNEKKGKITGIVSKEFLTIVGDGKKTLLELIKGNPRSYLQLDILKIKYAHRIEEVLAKGESLVLVSLGSHTLGAKFIDDSHKIDHNLTDTINEICVNVPGFYYGRLDILCNSLEELALGKNFKVIEINGAGSEPTHMYDPKHSLFYAWREINRHWKMMFKVSKNKS